MRSALVLPLCLLCTCVAEAADRLTLKNGDIITGTVIKKQGKKLTLKSDFLGEVSLPWEAVRSLESEEPLTVTLPDGSRVAGRVSTAENRLIVGTPEATFEALLGAVGDIRNPEEQHRWERLQNPGILQLWTGFVDIGLALARGNARTDTLTSGLEATRVTRKDKLALRFNQIRGTARVDNKSSTIASAIRGGWSYNRDVTPRFFISTFNDYEADRFQQLDLRFAAGAGFGANAFKTAAHTLSFQGGANYSRENFTGDLDRNSAEANFGNDLLWKINGGTSINQSFRFFTNLSQTGEYRVNLDVGTVTAIKKWLGWQVSASDRYLSNPVLERQRNDLLLSTGFRISFGQ